MLFRIISPSLTTTPPYLEEQVVFEHHLVRDTTF